ncbi:MAG TPA: ABC transporter permease [bacterium]|mgnify:CR=1 FL=1|nr:ABC transporter permease [bacterium]
MSFLAPLVTAYNSLKAHKVRSVLTILGLLVGVVSIIVVLNMGQGIKYYILNQSAVFGSDFVQVEIKVPATKQSSSENAIGMAQGITITTLKFSDAEKIGKLNNVRGFYAYQMGQAVVSYDTQNKTTMLWGISAQFFDLYQAKVQRGRSFTAEEERSMAAVAVIGPALEKKLFNGSDGIGQRIKVGDKKFTVIGVMEEQGNYMGFLDMDNMVYLPLLTLQKQILGIDYVTSIMAYLKDANQGRSTAEEIIFLLRQLHNITDPKKDDFAVTTMEDALAMINTLSGGITLLLVAIAGISLLVGGVGIMNIMFVSVSERTYEIGLRKSVGATKKNILWQFLWEAVLLTFSGGIIGVLLGTLFSFGISLAAKSFGFDWGFNLSWSGIVLSVCFSVTVGLIFGLRPAKKAADLNPVEALRKE